MGFPIQIALHSVQLPLLLYIVLTISILIGQEPPAYFENSRYFVDKHDYSIICYPIISADYVPVKSKLQHPPRKFEFLETFWKIPPSPGRKAVQMPPPPPPPAKITRLPF